MSRKRNKGLADATESVRALYDNRTERIAAPPQPRVVYCQETGVPILWRGVGRPPKWCPEVAYRKRKENGRLQAAKRLQRQEAEIEANRALLAMAMAAPKRKQS